jgi:SAM-dependent methyltransferase
VQPALEDISPLGYDESAYSLREKGYSPEPVRDAAWELAGKYARGRVVEIGSGSGGWVKRLQQNPEVERVTAVDIVDDGAGTLGGVDFHLLDVSSSPLPCAPESVDWVFAVEVIEHLANPRHFMKEAHRCLKSGGRALVTTPCNESITARLSFLFRGYFPAFCEHDYRMSGHITPVTELELKRMANEAGFRRVEFSYPLPGRIPKSRVEWQQIIPRLKGKLWSDTLFALLTK